MRGNSSLLSGIFGHFFLRASIIQGVAGVFLLAVVLPGFNHFHSQMLVEQGRIFANSTLAATIDALYENDYGKVVDYCMDVMQNTPNVQFIVYKNKSGEELIIRPDSWAVENGAQPDSQSGSEKSGAVKTALQFQPDRTFRFDRTIIIGGKDWGAMTIGLSKEAYFSGMKTFYWMVIASTIWACLLSLYLFFSSSRKIRSQMSSLGVVARKLSRGDLSVSAPEVAIGEIGVLGKAINQMSKSLKEKSERIFQLAQIVEQTNDAFVLFNSSHEIIFANAALAELTGYPSSYFIGMPFSRFSELFKLSPDLLQKIDSTVTEDIQISTHDVVFERGNHSFVDVEMRLELIVGDEARAYNILAVLSDITKRKRSEAELKIAASIFESDVGMIVTDADRRILRSNQAFTRITGYLAEDVVGQTPRMLNSGRQSDDFYKGMWERLSETGTWEGEIWNRRKNGEVYPEYLTITAIKNAEGVVSNYVATFTDITSSKAAADEIKNLAFFDPLTGLPNRRLLLDRLSQAMASCARSGKGGAILFVDLDNFKALNDTRGHDIGDLLLKAVAARLSACIREGDTVARLGGDEFVVMLEGLSEKTIEAAAQVEVVGEKVLMALNQPYQLGEHEHHNTPSIGATLFNAQYSTTDELLKQADIAMYQSKTAGRNQLRFFDPKMQESINARVFLESELRAAIEAQQFQLHYQLQVDRAGSPLGAEALIRWTHPVRGNVPPMDFIPLAEETGLILPLGKWVLEAACDQIKMWQGDALTSSITVAVNISVRQFRQADFADQVKSIVTSHGINAKLLKLELTESLFLDDIDQAVVTMNALNALGIQFSLDDFGTGYSSLQYLKQLPLGQIKIDQSFIRNLASENSDREIVNAMIAMAKSLKLEVIAEGVETEAQRQLLLDSGCPAFQGYLFSRPLPVEAFEQLLRQI